jgi:hypothetical protein
MKSQLKQIAYDAAYNAFFNSHLQDRAGLNENQIKILDWVEPSMADAYAQIMVATEGNQKEALRIIQYLYKPENLVKIFKAIEAGELEEIFPGLNI